MTRRLKGLCTCGLHEVMAGRRRNQRDRVRHDLCVVQYIIRMEQLPENVLFRIARGDAKGKAFGTPRNPRAPALEEFNPRIAEVRAGDLAGTIVARKHGIFPEQAERVGQLSNDELIRFRVEDPISATQADNGLSLTGGHHRTHEIIQRVQASKLDPNTIIRVLLHD
jgi:hypothetical protein